MSTRRWALQAIRTVAILTIVAATLLPASVVAAPSNQAAEPNTIRLPLTEPPTLDPGLATDNVSVEVVKQIFEPLVDFDDNNNVYPVEAESWDISPDGLTYTFYLRPGLRWSDGNPVTAYDYEFAWKRNIDPKTASDYANTLFPVKNAEKINKGEMSPDDLGVRALDERTLEVQLEAPASYFLRLASTWTLMPQPRWAVEAYGDKWIEAGNIVTNGKFRLDSWDHDRQLVLVRNEDYWGPKPSLERVIYVIYPDAAAEQVLAAYEAGELDSTGKFGIAPAHVDRVLADPVLSQEVQVFPQSRTFFITVNHRRPHLRDPRVRMALGKVIERDKLIRDVLKIVAEPAYSLQPPGILGQEPGLWPRESVEEARALMAAAGYPNGQGFPTITFAYNSAVGWQLLGAYLQQRFKETLGINLKLEAMEWKVFLKWKYTPDWTERGDIYRGGWGSDYEDPNNWYNVLWDSKEDPIQFNGGWDNPTYNSLVRRGQSELDPEAREIIYRQAEAILATEYPHIPLYHSSVRSLVKPYVQGYSVARILEYTLLDRITVLPH